jgi:serine/threonine protein kinase
MLNAAYANKKDQRTYDRRKKTGCNKASDVWALGCLFFELLTGEFLFYDTDWVRFFIRVTYDNQVCGCLF